MRNEKAIIIVFCCLVFLFPYGVNAQTFEEYFEKACSNTTVTKNLAMTIARHESGMNPFAVNVAGKSYMPKTREEAVKIIQSARQKGLSYDVGLMQVNNQWTKKWKIDPLSLLDVETNISLGIHILASEIDAKGFSWAAVGAYHSPNPERGRNYAWLIYRLATGSQKSTLARQEVKATAITVASPAKKKTQRPKNGVIKNAHKAEAAPILLYRAGTTKDTSSGRERRIIRF